MVDPKQAEVMEEWLKYDKPLHPALVPWVREGTALGPMVKHPFVFSILGNGMPMFNLEPNKIYEAKIKMRREILDERDWWAFLFILVERPWRMEMLERLYFRNRISHAELIELLPETWLDTECPQINQDEPMRLFRAAGFVTDDPEGWAQISKQKKLILYRGVDGEMEITKDGPSWTLDRKVADFFAHRYGAKGKVYTYTADVSEALAYFTAREEAEIILDFDRQQGGLSKRKEIRLVKA